MKKLINITEEEVRTICEFYDEIFLSYRANDLDELGPDLVVSIETVSSKNHTRYDSHIFIYKDGKVRLVRNRNGWNVLKRTHDEDINPLITTDYLRKKGYDFKYEIPKNLSTKIKLIEINNKSKLFIFV